MSTEDRDNASPHTPVKDVTGVILAGGRSIRFGSDKAFAELGGVSLIDRIVTVMGAVFEDLIIVTNEPDKYSFLGLPMYQDIIKGVGPLGGIYTGLERMPANMGFFVACDMPFLNGDLMRYMLDEKGGVDAVIPKIGWKMEPLHSIYSKACIPAVREVIESGERMIIKFYQKIHVRFIDEQELKGFDPLSRFLININRTNELAEAENLEQK